MIVRSFLICFGRRAAAVFLFTTIVIESHSFTRFLPPALSSYRQPNHQLQLPSMRVSVLSTAALLALVATFASAARAPQCQGLLAKRGGGFFSDLTNKIDSVTKSGTDVSPMHAACCGGRAGVGVTGDLMRWSLCPLFRTRYCSEDVVGRRASFFRPTGPRQGDQVRGQGDRKRLQEGRRRRGTCMIGWRARGCRPHGGRER